MLFACLFTATTNTGVQTAVTACSSQSFKSEVQLLVFVMWITLLVIVTHPLFKWTKCSVKLRSTLVANIKDLSGTDMDFSPTSEGTKVIKQLKNLIMRKHKGCKSVGWIIQN